MNNSTFMENLRQLFAECDTANNGSLGREEFGKLCSKIGLGPEAASETFDRLDSDKNDRITFEEFAAGFYQYNKQQSPANSPVGDPTSPCRSPTTRERNLFNSDGTSNNSNSSNSLNQPPVSLDLTAAGGPQRISLNPSTPKTSRSPMPASAVSSPTAPQMNPIAQRARKNVSPLGVISLGSTGSSNLRTSSSATGITTQESDQMVSTDYGDGVGANNNQKSDSMIIYSSDALENDYDQASGSGQYGSLISSCGSLGQMRNVQDLLDCVQKLQNENQILTQIFFKDKREREEYINQLGEEFDQQVREVEERAHRRAREELESEKRRLREMMAAERETLQHHFKTIEKMSKMVKNSNGKLGSDEIESIDKVKTKLEDTYLENRQLKKSLLDTKTDVAMIWKEMEKLKKQYEDKLSNAYEKNNETRSECDHIKKQLNLMKDSNKKLQDASDVITNYITDKVEPVIKVATGEVGDDIHGSHLSLNGSCRFPGSQSNSRRGSILSEYLNGDNSGANDPLTANSLDGYGGSVNSADLESFGSGGNLQQHMVNRNTSRFSKSRSNNNHMDDDQESSSSSTGNFHLRVPESRPPQRTQSEQRLRSSCAPNDNSDINIENRDRSQHKRGSSASVTDQSSSQVANSISSRQAVEVESSSAKRSNSQQLEERQSQLKSDNQNEQQKAFGLRNIGRHFFIGTRAHSDAKADQAAKIKLEAELKQSVSVDSSDEPVVESADGPSKATFNIILVGDSFVGKSSFAARFMEGSFVQGLISNCSIDFKTKNYKVDGTNYTVNLWDTAGQERFRSITASYFRKADGIILMYDVTDKRSYLNVRNWMSTISDTASEDVAVLLVGNKIDLRQKDNQERCVPAEEGYRLAKEYDIVFLETSVKTGINLIPSMGRLIRLIAKNNQPAEDEKDRIRLNDKSRTFNCMPKNC